MQKSYIKHMVCTVLAVILLVWASSCNSAAAAPEATPISAFSYILDAENATITLTKYTGPGGAVNVAGSYTVDGAEYKTLLDSAAVFRDNAAITSAVISEGVALTNYTAAYLFAGCTKLSYADISGLDTAGVTNFRGIFSGCAALKCVNLTGLDTSCVTSMAGMFYNCAKLAELTGYESWNTGALESLYMTFSGTSALKTVDLSCWDLSKLKNSGWCFQSCGASQILLPDSLKVISAGFFNHASNYAGTSFTIPVGVEQIGYAHTFYDLGTSAFREFKVAEGNPHFKAANGVLYTADGKKLLAVPRSKAFDNGVFEIPEGVIFLGELSFSRNQNIKTLVLPDSLEIYHVGLNDENYIIYEDVGNLNQGSNLSIALYCYTGVNQYAVKDTNPRYAGVDGILYSKDMKSLVAVPSRYDQHMTIPEGVTSWRSEAIWNVDSDVVDGLMAKCTGVTIPSTLVDIAPDQINKLNRLNKAYKSFQISVSAQNPVYCLDANGNLTTHSFTSQTLAPDCVKGGYTLSTCAACGHSVTSAQTEPLGHSFSKYVRQGNTKIAACDRGCGATDVLILSSNCSLLSLQVQSYALLPAFQEDITTYTVFLPYEADRLQVSAIAADAIATVEIVGGDKLAAGEDNEIRVICIAEDGSEKIYNIIAQRAAEPAPTEPPVTLPIQNTDDAQSQDNLVIWMIAGTAVFMIALFAYRTKNEKNKTL